MGAVTSIVVNPMKIIPLLVVSTLDHVALVLVAFALDVEVVVLYDIQLEASSFASTYMHQCKVFLSYRIQKSEILIEQIYYAKSLKK